MDQENLPASSVPPEVPAAAPTQPVPSGGRFAFADAEFAEDAQDGGDTIKRSLGAVVYYKWLVLAITLVGCVGAFLVSRTLDLTYTAEARLWISVTDRISERQGPIQSPELLQGSAWVELLRSYTVLDPVVREHRLYLQYRASDRDVLGGLQTDSVFLPGSYIASVDPSGTTVELREERRGVIERVRVGESIGRSVGLRWTPPAAGLTPERQVVFELEHPRATARYVMEAMNPRLVGDNFLMLQYEHNNPQLAAKVLNSFTTEYVDLAADLKRAKLDEFRDILEQQLTYSEENLRRAELALESFRVQTITLPSDPATPVNPGIEATRDPALSSYFQLSIDRESLQRDRDAIARLLADARTEPLSVDALTAVPTVMQSPELMQALTELTESRAELRALGRQYTDEHPLMRQAAERTDHMQHNVVPGLARTLVAHLDQRLVAMDQLVTSAAGELRAIPPRTIDEARFTRAVQSAATLYNELRSRYENARLAAETTIPDVRILDPARAPELPSTNPRVPVLLIGFIMSLGLAIGVAILLERFDPRIRYPEQVSDTLHLPILGVLPHLASATRRNGDPDRKEAVEALRSVRLNLTHAYGAAGPLMLTVSSPGSGDGKSFVTGNMGLSFADLGKRTLLIDGDTRRGTMHRLLGIDRVPGLTDYLAGRAELDDVIKATRAPKLDVIPCGTRFASAPELLSSPRMGLLLARIRSTYQVILVDSAPLGAGVDPLVLGTATGNVMLIIRPGTTDRGMAETKISMLDRLPIRVLGAVVNGLRAGGGYRYYQYYSYLPGYTADDEAGEQVSLLEPA